MDDLIVAALVVLGVLVVALWLAGALPMNVGQALAAVGF